MRALPEISLLRHLHTAKVAIAAALGLLLDLAAVLLALLALGRNLSCHYGTDVRSRIAWRGEQRDLEVSVSRGEKFGGRWRRNNLRGPLSPHSNAPIRPSLGF